METGPRPKWAASVAAELYRHGAKGSLWELVAFALELWATEGHHAAKTVAMRYLHAYAKEESRPSKDC